MGRRPSKDSAAFSRAIRNGATLKDAKLQAGYTENVARMGLYKLPARLANIVLKRTQELEALGRSLDADAQENVVRGRLLKNVLTGKDQATRSAELLGKDKRVAMFQPDHQTGIINITLPQTMLDAVAASLRQPQAAENKGNILESHSTQAPEHPSGGGDE